MIDGVIRKQLRIIPDDRGAIMHMLRKDWPEFAGFGEIYFSCVAPGAIKAWRQHTKMTMQLAVPHGSVEFVMYDARPDSPSNGAIQREILSPDSNETYGLLVIPPGIWNGFRCVSGTAAVVANCASLPHDPDEAIGLPADDSSIPYSWPDT